MGKPYLTRCRVCKCTEEEPCNPPCGWERNEPDLCTTCADIIRHVRDWMEGAHRPSFAALNAEAKYNHAPGELRHKVVFGKQRKAATR